MHIRTLEADCPSSVQDALAAASLARERVNLRSSERDPTNLLAVPNIFLWTRLSDTCLTPSFNDYISRELPDADRILSCASCSIPRSTATMKSKPRRID